MAHRTELLFVLLHLVGCCSPDTAPATGLYVDCTSLSTPPTGSECSPFRSLAQALSALQAEDQGEITLLPANQTYEETLAPIERTLVLQGTNNRLTLIQALHITKEGKLWVEDLAVRGKAIVEGVVVLSRVSLESALLEVRNGGELRLLDCVMGDGDQGGIRVVGVGAILSVRNVTYWSNSASFLAVESPANGDISIEIANSSFTGNTPTALILLSATSTDLNVSLTITYCSFTNNSGAIVLSRASYLAFQLLSSYIHNSGSGLTIEGPTANISIADIAWERNSGFFLKISTLKTAVDIRGVTIREQREGGLVTASGLGLAEDCKVWVDSVDYRDTSYLELGEAGIFTLRNCWGFLQNCRISNVSISGYFGRFYAYFVVYQGFLRVNSLSIENSASNQALFYMTISNALISNLAVHRFGAGLNLLLVAGLCPNITLSDIRLYSVEGTSTSDNLSNAPSMLVHIAFQLSNLTIAGLVVDSSVCKSMVVTYIGTASIADLRVRNVSSIMGLLILAWAEATTRNVVITGKVHTVWSCAADSSLTAQNYTLTSLTMNFVLVCGTGSMCSMSDLAIKDSQAKLVLLAAQFSLVTLTNFAMSQITAKFAFSIFSQSRVHIHNATFTHCQLNLASLYKGQLRLSDFHVGSIQSTGTFISAIMASVQLVNGLIEDVVIRNGQLGYFTEASSLAVLNSVLVTVNATTGVKVTDSSVSILNSQFSRLYFTLFEGKASNVTISQSQFSNGGSNQRGISQKGALLSCQKCPFVAIDSIQAVHMSAPVGGAIALELSTLSLANSRFSLCSAEKGGALLLIETAYVIKHANFSYCSAEKTGGALDIDSSDRDSVVENSCFSGNAAKKEGGAIKFHREVAALVSVVFDRNEADYGRNVASYGVSARISSAFPINLTFVSGNYLPTELNIEVVDHFAQVVTSDSSSELQVLPSSLVQHGGFSTTISNNGLFHLQNSPFYALPGSTQCLSLTIRLPLGNVDFQFNMSFRACELGEISMANQCLICTAGSYSLLANDTQCQLCPAHVKCKGKNWFEVDEGYWRSGRSTALVHACPYRELCEGGLESKCSEGYAGKLCMECARDYYRVGTLYCEKCSVPSAVCQGLLYVGQLSLVLFLLFRYLKSDELETKHRSAVVYLWLEHCQYLLVVLRLKVQLPWLFFYTIRPLQYAGSLSVLSLPTSCLFQYDKSIYISAALQYLIPSLVLLPNVGLILKAPHSAKPWKGLLSQWLLVSCLFGPAMVESYASLLVSFKFEDSKWWLYSEAGTEAWGPEHLFRLKYLFTPLFAGYVLVPSLLRILISIFSLLDWQIVPISPAFHSFFQSKFQIFGEMAQIWKLGLIFTCISVTALSPLFQVALTLSLLIPVLLFLVGKQPYVHPYLLYLAVASKLVVYMTLSAAGYYTDMGSKGSSSGYFSVVCLSSSISPFSYPVFGQSAQFQPTQRKPQYQTLKAKQLPLSRELTTQTCLCLPIPLWRVGRVGSRLSSAWLLEIAAYECFVC